MITGFRYADHNHLRVSRIIRSLALLQGKEAAKQFLALIEARVEAAGNPVKSTSQGVLEMGAQYRMR